MRFNALRVASNLSTVVVLSLIVEGLLSLGILGPLAAPLIFMSPYLYLASYVLAAPALILAVMHAYTALKAKGSVRWGAYIPIIAPLLFYIFIAPRYYYLLENFIR